MTLRRAVPDYRIYQRTCVISIRLSTSWRWGPPLAGARIERVARMLPLRNADTGINITAGEISWKIGKSVFTFQRTSGHLSVGKCCFSPSGKVRSGQWALRCIYCGEKKVLLSSIPATIFTPHNLNVPCRFRAFSQHNCNPLESGKCQALPTCQPSNFKPVSTLGCSPTRSSPSSINSQQQWSA